MERLRGGRQFRAFGSLNDGSAVPALAPDEMPLKENVEHDSQGDVTKRPGRRIAHSLLNHGAAPRPILVLDSGGGSLSTGTLYVRLTFSTVAGETDDTNVVETSVSVSDGDAVWVWAPLHLKRRLVEHHDRENKTLTLAHVPVPADIAASMTGNEFNSWHMWMRDPSRQDSTNLGINLNASKKLWDRKNIFAKVAGYASDTRTITLDRDVPTDLTGQYVDFMYPDRPGLPIRAVNVYVSQDGVTYYHHASWDGPNGFWGLVTTVDTSAAQSPATRVTRTAPTVVATTVNDTDPVNGRTSVAYTGIKAGEYWLRYCWETAKPSHLANDGWPDDSQYHVGSRELRAPQRTWPSDRGIVQVFDDQGIAVTLPTFPSGVRKAHVYAYKHPADSTLSFSGVTAPASGHRAYLYGGASLTVGDLSPSDFRADGDTSEFTTDQYSDIGAVSGSVSLGSGVTSKAELEIELDSAEQSSRTLVFRLLLTVARGAAYAPNGGGTLKVRHWDEDASAWTTLKTLTSADIGVKSVGLAVALTSDMLESGRFVIDLLGENSLTASLANVMVEPHYTGAWATGLAATFWQDESTDTTLTLQNPLNTSVGDPMLIDTTSQWPCVVFAARLPAVSADPGDNIRLMIGCADSVFEIQPDGSPWRIYQQDAPDGSPSLTTMNVTLYDWRFTHVLTRTFFCNPGLETHNLRFDGVQTHIMGLDPPTGVPPESDSAAALYQVTWHWMWTGDKFGDGYDNPYVDNENLRVWINKAYPPPGPSYSQWYWPGAGSESPSRWDARWSVLGPDGTWYYFLDLRGTPWEEIARGMGFPSGITTDLTRLGHDLEFQAPNAFQSDVLRYLETAADVVGVAGTGEPAPSDSGIQGDYDYYVVSVRRHQSYIARSKPVRVIGAVNLAELSSVPLSAYPPDDPQVTHYEFYRNINGTASYFLVGDGVPLVEDGLDESGYVTAVDDTQDDYLGHLVNFETGRPPAARFMRYHAGRVWLALRNNPDLAGFTNITSPSGAIDPEGWYAKNVLDAQLPRSSPATAFSSYHQALLIHSDNGIVAVTGVSDELDSPAALRADALLADAGAIGPDAWCNVGNAQYVLTRQGPSVILGSELTYIGAKVEGTAERMNRKDAVAETMRCAFYRANGKAQVISTYSDRSDGVADACLVLDGNVGPGMDEERVLWTKWVRMECHGVVNSERPNGEELLLWSDQLGRVHEHGAMRTDNGRFIDADMLTKYHDDDGRSDRPRWLYVHAAGRSTDTLYMDVRRDYSSTAINTRPIRVALEGVGASVWGQAAWGAFLWAEVPLHQYQEKRVSIGRPMRNLQLRFYQKWASLKPGTRRDASFSATGFDLFASKLGARRIPA
jgi:hypothetical protein